MIKVIGSALIKNTEGKYLALKLKKEIVGNNYVPPGGKLEENETLRECVIREVKEELNIDIEVKEIKGITEEKYDDGTWTFVLFDCVIIFGEPQITELDKISEIKWVELSEIKNSNSILWIDNNLDRYPLNMKQKYKAMVSDIDGTLTPIAPNSYPTDKATKHIKEAIHNGLIFSLASGRPFSMVKYIANHLGNVGPCIVDNGAVIVDPISEEILWEAILPSSVANNILNRAKSYELTRASCDIGIFENTHSVPLESKVRKVSIHNINHSEAERLIKEITSEYEDVVGIKAASYEGDHLIDIYFSNINATKQNAVVKLSEIWGIPSDEIIGIGDGHNDVSLLNACGLKIAMGNAVDELKAIAHYIAPSYIDDGIIDVINKYYN